MKDKKIILKNLILFIELVIYFFLVIYKRNQYIYNMSYTKCIIFMLLLSLFIYVYGIVINKDKTYRNNIMVYIVLFFILLISITFIIGRDKIHFYTWWYAGQYKILYTVKSQLKYGSIKSVFKNIIGNSVMLMPLSFLLIIKDKKYKNIFRQSIIILPIIIIIELLQAFTHTGAFDIDDIFLNYLGTVLFTFIITRFNIIDKIKTIFYRDYNLKESIKSLIFYISLFILIIFNLFCFLSH